MCTKLTMQEAKPMLWPDDKLERFEGVFYNEWKMWAQRHGREELSQTADCPKQIAQIGQSRAFEQPSAE
jgi:hypothetical protein